MFLRRYSKYLGTVCTALSARSMNFRSPPPPARNLKSLSGTIVSRCVTHRCSTESSPTPHRHWRDWAETLQNLSEESVTPSDGPISVPSAAVGFFVCRCCHVTSGAKPGKLMGIFNLGPLTGSLAASRGPVKLGTYLALRVGCRCEASHELGTVTVTAIAPALPR